MTFLCYVNESEEKKKCRFLKKKFAKYRKEVVL